jgi:hypothetical protein
MVINSTKIQIQLTGPLIRTLLLFPHPAISRFYKRTVHSCKVQLHTTIHIRYPLILLRAVSIKAFWYELLDRLYGLAVRVSGC